MSSVSRPFRIGVVAPGGPMQQTLADQALTAAGRLHGEGLELVFHPHCFERSGHFAGEDTVREDAFVQMASDPDLDAVWFGRGGYGACRMAEAALARLGPAAHGKRYLGYSDAGMVLAGLYRHGIGRVAHGPMVQDLAREGGDAAFARALDWLMHERAETLEAGLDERPAAAFNITILSHLLGTALEPDLTGHVLLLEDVSEHMYRIDRALFHILGQPRMAALAGLRMGRCSDVPDNDPDFGLNEAAIARQWCARAGVPWLGRADIGHDSANKVVPFGHARRP